MLFLPARFEGRVSGVASPESGGLGALTQRPRRVEVKVSSIVCPSLWPGEPCGRAGTSRSHRGRECHGLSESGRVSTRRRLWCWSPQSRQCQKESQSVDRRRRYQLILTDPLRDPACVGIKVTVIVQVAPTLRLEPHLFC